VRAIPFGLQREDGTVEIIARYFPNIAIEPIQRHSVFGPASRTNAMRLAFTSSQMFFVPPTPRIDLDVSTRKTSQSARASVRARRW
jgi:hypothetical protein